MRLLASLCFPLALIATPALAGTMNADAFYAVAKELSAKGMRAMFDSRTKPTINAMKAAAASAKSANATAEKRGAPLYCVPAAARKKGLGPDQVVTWLGEVPAAQRKRQTLSQTWLGILVAKYPC